MVIGPERFPLQVADRRRKVSYIRPLAVRPQLQYECGPTLEALFVHSMSGLCQQQSL